MTKPLHGFTVTVESMEVQPLFLVDVFIVPQCRNSSSADVPVGVGVGDPEQSAGLRRGLSRVLGWVGMVCKRDSADDSSVRGSDVCLQRAQLGSVVLVIKGCGP